MKYHILHDFRNCTPLKKSFDHFKDLDKLKLLRNSEVDLTYLQGIFMN